MSLNQLFEQLVGGLQVPAQNANGQNTQSQGSGTAGQRGLSGLTDMIPGGLNKGMVGGLAAGGLLGVLMGNKKMRKTAGKMAGGAVGLAGAAALGAVAFNAYKNWQSGTPPTPAGGSAAPAQLASPPAAPAPSTEAFNVVENTASDGQPFQVALIKAMIGAANADGHIDSKEQAAVFDAVNKMEMDASDKALVFDTLQSPPDVETVAGFSKGLEQSSEIYLVSRMAIDPDEPSEQAYLSRLAGLMAMPDDLVAHLENEIAQAQA